MISVIGNERVWPSKVITPQVISLPGIKPSMSTCSSSTKAFSIAEISSDSSLTFDIPTLEPPLFGFTKHGRPVVRKIATAWYSIPLKRTSEGATLTSIADTKRLQKYLLKVMAEVACRMLYMGYPAYPDNPAVSVFSRECRVWL